MRTFALVLAPLIALPFAARAEDGYHLGVQVTGIGAVRPANFEVLARTPMFGAGFGYSFVPGFVGDAVLSAVGAKNGSMQASLDDFSAWDLDLRVFPFEGSFFAGASAGRQHVKGSVTDTSAPPGNQTALVDVSTWYATPRVGWLARWSSGFTLGFDVGVQIALASQKDVRLPPGASTTQQSNVNNIVDAAASIPLPTVNLRVGWMF